MKVLELFSGTECISNAFRKRNHFSISIENNPIFRPTILGDILTLDMSLIYQPIGSWERPDVIWASPPCTAFSVASIGTNWTGGKGAYIPKTDKARLGIELVKRTLQTIDELKPKLWFIENPRGVLREMPFMQGLKRYTVCYCRYGDIRMKPTDIWTNATFVPRMCHNGNPDHEQAPRGSKTGTQGLKNAMERGRIPKLFCEEIVNICERGLNHA